MEKQIKFTNEMNTSMFKHKRHSWFFSSTWILLLLLSFFMWKCEKDIFEDETIGVCPEVISSDPADEATNVVTSKIITATFNEEMLPATINNQTFSVKQGTVPVSGIVTYADKIATFSPSEPLEGNKMYSGNITKKVKDPAGNYPLENYSWSFSTSNVPTVTSTDPLNATSNVPLDKIITATFSTAMDPSTINTATFLVNQGTDQIAGTITENKGMPMAMAKQSTKQIAGTKTEKKGMPMASAKQDTNPIAGSVSYSGTTATFTPTSPLTDNTVYTGTITIAAKDVAGNAMASHYKWSFSTAQTQYTITLSSNPAEGGSTSGGGLLNKDSQTTVIATPFEGYTFANWTEGANIVSSNTSYDIIVTSDRTLVAHFE
ncbi:MAG: Ig-like domain-containing protein, partial [Prolixibacteraceae bacterium]|nr:Ig-like domain-containing protein [Prolixibacteraceae bacterium]